MITQLLNSKNKTVSTLLLIFFIGQAFAQNKNLVSLASGVKILKAPASYAEFTERSSYVLYSPSSLIDESDKIWCSKGTTFPMEFVFELTELCKINKLFFNNVCENYDGIHTKELKVEYSSKSANEDYKLFGNYTLSKNKINEYPVDAEARWIKLTILSNYGNKEYVELSEFKVFCHPAQELSSTIRIDGTWHTNWQDIIFHQTGNTFTGDYEYDGVVGKVTNGVITRNELFFHWKEGNRQGTAKLYLNAEGNRLSGDWINSNNSGDFGVWEMQRKRAIGIDYKSRENANIVSASPIIPEKVVRDEAIEFDGQKIEIGENIVFNNVIFVQSKAILLESSYSELDKLVEILLKNENLKVELSGHTDNQGNVNLNIKLSEERVETVKKYFVAKGIASKRISGKGYGPSKPINDNKNELERKLNRRVEFKLF
ncbi:OmpA family protein [Pseudochryseolinea flava]|nr:OmpA family protein [Pseudochryseolinea flava]